MNINQLLNLLYVRTGNFLPENMSFECILQRRSNDLRKNGHLKSCYIDEYLKYIDKSDSEIEMLVDVYTNHTTVFFRDETHFDFLSKYLVKKKNGGDVIRLWSAGCSTGEEPYSMAMVVHSFEMQKRVKILGTDISGPSIVRAQRGVYSKDRLGQNKYSGLLNQYVIENGNDSVIVSPDIKHIVMFRHSNLLTRFHKSNYVDIIFCRNVLHRIEQDKHSLIVRNLYNALKPGGYLVIGSCDRLKKNTVLDIGFTLYQPAIFQKPDVTSSLSRTCAMSQ